MRHCCVEGMKAESGEGASAMAYWDVAESKQILHPPLPMIALFDLTLQTSENAVIA